MADITKEMMEKHPKKFEELAEKLQKEENYTLPKVLEDKLNAIKNTPIEEKAIADKMKSSTKEMEDGNIQSDEINIEIVESIYTIDEIQKLLDTDCKLKDIAEFGARVINKVFIFKDENGELKEIESHKDLKPLAYIEKKELRKITNKIRNVFAGENPYTEVNLKKFQKVQEEARDYVFEKCKYLDIDSMSDWEKNLLVEKVKANATGHYEPQMGKN